jgi:hypothetical protein
MLFYAASFLAPYYLIAGVVRCAFGWCRRLCPHCAASASAAAVLLLLMATAAQAQTDAPYPTTASDGRPYVIQIVKPAPPVHVPDDAIILPYDPDWKNIARDADRLLLPYEKYVELWNRAYPDKKIEPRTPPAPYALAGATYATQLEGEEFLGLTGRIEIDIMADGYVEIPLSLGGGVLAGAEVDGQPARLRVAANLQDHVEQLAQTAVPQAAVDRAAVSLFVSGKGRHKLELSVRLKLVRQGGWRVVQGVLPSAPAAKLSIVVPTPKTELRLGLVADRRKYDTTLAGEKIETALGPGGSIQLQWRPAVAEGQFDRSLTAVSAAVLDVQEDGLRLAWQLGLEFRRSQRDRFRVDLPAGYLLEKIEGQNVRGWELQKTERGRAVEIVLLQPAKDYEQFILRLWRAETAGRKEESSTRFAAPQIVVPDAALHTGQLTIRRSPLLDLRTTDRVGVSRTDLPSDDSRLAALVGGRESSLKIRPFEAYTFASVPFTLAFEASPVVAQTTVRGETIVKVSENELKFETRMVFCVEGRKGYMLRTYLPDDLRVDDVSAPGEFQYAVTRLDNRPLLTVYLAVGRQNDVPVGIRGRLANKVSWQGKSLEVLLPRYEALDVDGQPVLRQELGLIVQTDPAYNVEAIKLGPNCDLLPLGQFLRGMDAGQRAITRLALRCQSHGNYAGTLRLTPRHPDVACDTITNVRVTDRALEETILLDFNIQNAGIREFSFLLPAEMAESRIKVPMLRQKTIERAGKEPDSPIRVKIELQDEVMGQLRVLIENDRLLKPGSHEAPMPAVELGRIGRRYVTIENVGRDEIVVDSDKSRDMEQLGTRQKDWTRLTNILGREMTMAYVASTDAKIPRLAFHARARATVVTVKAEIGLAETTLAVDAAGAYRASQVLNMNNATEQFLEIRLPEGAELWTAYVAGEPVKPVQSPAAAGAKAATRDVRIPIIKTAPGQSDYQVVLKYGGKMPTPAALREVNFPLIRSLNIAPERSQVRLYVPDDYRWFYFGGTMRQTDEEADLLAGYINYNSKQLSQTAMAFQQGDKWTRARASANIKVQKEQADAYQRAIASSNVASNGALQAELAANGEQWRQTAESLARQEQSPAKAQADNRKQLNLAFESQKNGLAKNVVELSAANRYGVTANAPANGPAAGGETSSFNDGWLVQNKLIDEEETAGGGMGGMGNAGLPSSFAFSGKTSDANSRLGLAGLQNPSAAQVNGQELGEQFSRQVAGSRKPQPLGRASQSFAQSVTPKLIIQEEEEEKLELAKDRQMFGARQSGEQRYQRRAEQQAQLQQVKQKVAQGGWENSYRNNFAANRPSSVTIAGTATSREWGGSQTRPNAPPSAAPTAREPRSQFRQDGGKLAEAITNANLDELIQLKEKGTEASRENLRENAERDFFARPTPPGAAVDLPAAGLTSLNVELPTRGRLFCFTTPRGETEITARCVSNNLLQRLTQVGATIAALLALWIVVRWIRRGGLSGVARPIGSTLLIVFGLLSICGGLFPVVGVLAIFTGCGLKMRRRCCR